MFNFGNGRWFRHLAPVLAMGVIGIVVSISVWYLTFTSENRAIGQEFSNRADNQAVALQNGIDSYWELLSSVRAFFESSNEATREEFESFSNFLLRNHAALLNVAWLPRIKREERAAHELAAARDGLPDYNIRAIVPDGGLPVSPEQDEYFPKFYSTEPRTSPLYGLDLNDGGMRAGAIARIRDGDFLSTSLPLMLYTGQGDRQGFWAGLPVYARDLPHETVEDRRRNLLGIVQGVFQISALFDAIASTVKTPVRVYLFTPESTIFDRPIYFASRAGAWPIEPKSQVKLAAGLHRSIQLNFGDVQWTLMVAPELGNIPLARHQSSSGLVDKRTAAQRGLDCICMGGPSQRPQTRNRE
jgi:CHASE1-domain containing sensor protein